jgi:hypothetical protein
MTTEEATRQLACLVMGWRLAPNRFLQQNRAWIPAWRFQPFVNVRDAEALLEASQCEYSLSFEKGRFTARILGEGCVATASGTNKANTITTALARSKGMEVKS